MLKGYSIKKRVGISVIALLLAFFSFVPSVLAFDKVMYANSDPNKYSIELDLTNKVITIYEKGKKNKYDQIAKQFICTTGTNATPTPEGTFRLNDSRRRFGFFRQYDVYGQYWTHVISGIYFHSILYTEKKEGKFTKTSYNALGSQASHGCIRMLVEDARWLYYNCPGGTTIKILSKEKDEELRKSLLPTTSASKYYPTPDQYESVVRGYPKALLNARASFTSTANVTTIVEIGKDVDVISSGKNTCRVRVDGVEGHIETKNLDFLPNGPKDQKNIAKAINAAKVHYEVKSKEATLYEKAGLTQKILGVFGKSSDLTIVGETESFHQVEIDNMTGFILKTDVVQVKGAMGSKPTVIKIKVEEPEVLEDENVEDDMVEEL